MRTVIVMLVMEMVVMIVIMEMVMLVMEMVVMIVIMEMVMLVMVMVVIMEMALIVMLVMVMVVMIVIMQMALSGSSTRAQSAPSFARCLPHQRRVLQRQLLDELWRSASKMSKRIVDIRQENQKGCGVRNAGCYSGHIWFSIYIPVSP